MKSYQIIFFVFIVVFVSCKSKPQEVASLPYFNSPDFTPVWIGVNEGKGEGMHSIQDFSFLNQNGETINKASFKDKIFVANFFFTICPGICPVMTENMLRLQNEFKNEDRVMLVSHTVTPWIDSVKQLKKYALEKAIDDSKYHLLTGAQEEIYKLARTSYFAEKEIGFKKEEDDFLHSENLLLIDYNYHIRGIFNGTKESDIDRLIKHLKILLEDG